MNYKIFSVASLSPINVRGNLVYLRTTPFNADYYLLILRLILVFKYLLNFEYIRRIFAPKIDLERESECISEYYIQH